MERERQWRIYQLQAEICRTLSDPKRLLILNELREGERSVTELARELGLNQANVSQHLALLRQGGLVKSRKDGANIYYSLATPRIIEACDIVHQLLVEQLERNQALAQEILRQ
ncbi:ArsR/SmtB family transcription factor [Candidatus Hakubella thermalkaliphila]|uniref:ArsR/SmtB family transcription factor n=1 Tax=Candidatus Hakubella thermalkaliphila TaxID=2754717 RepID=UPI0021591151|nr:metalloregulator ArsR/SmtB family transcription factor [Candidatus Hakubella thermalkaliphila]